jgi:hypothetical protein
MLDSNLENKLYFYKGLDVQTLRSCNEEEIWDINEKGYDIFWCLQEFKDGRRIKDNLRAFEWVCADFDSITEEEFSERIASQPKPTMLIRTRSGVHAYWRIDKITSNKKFLEEHKSFMENCIIPMGGDPNAKDVSRILRVPQSRYWSDSKGNRYEDKEIRCEVIYDNGPKWKWEQLQRLFRKNGIATQYRSNEQFFAARKAETPSLRVGENNNNFWARCNAYPVRQGIEALSGSPTCRGQRFTFMREGKITRVLVDGKPSNAWIDERGRFGSTYENTAGTLVNFLKFPEYGLDNATIAKVFKEVLNVRE